MLIKTTDICDQTIRGYNGQNSTEIWDLVFLIWSLDLDVVLFNLGIAMSWFSILQETVFETLCRGFMAPATWTSIRWYMCLHSLLLVDYIMLYYNSCSLFHGTFFRIKYFLAETWKSRSIITFGSLLIWINKLKIYINGKQRKTLQPNGS